MSNLNPDYNWPTLNRKDLMSLSTINPTDAKFRQFKKIDTNRDTYSRSVLYINDKNNNKNINEFVSAKKR